MNTPDVFHSDSPNKHDSTLNTPQIDSGISSYISGTDSETCEENLDKNCNQVIEINLNDELWDNSIINELTPEFSLGTKTNYETNLSDCESTSLNGIQSREPSRQSKFVPLKSENSPEVVDAIFIRKLLDDAYKHDENEDSKAWEACVQSSPTATNRKRILMRELSFDELKDLNGVDLLAPVFLAVTNTFDDNFDLRKRKSKSIEDLCSRTLSDTEDGSKMLRSRSTILYLASTESHNPSSTEMVNEQHNSSTNTENPVSVGDCRSITISDLYNESIDDSLEDQAFLDVLVNNDSYVQDEEGSGLTFHSWNDIGVLTYESDSQRLLSEGTFDEGSSVMKLCMDEDKPYVTKSPIRKSVNTYRYWDNPVDSITFGLDGSINTCSTIPYSNRYKRFVVVNVAGQHRIVDTTLIDPYVKVLSHGGHHYVGEERRVIIVICACFLPECTTEKYEIIMEQLFYYCIHALDLLVTDTYEIIFFNTDDDSNKMPHRAWVKQIYYMIQYRLKKQMKKIYFVYTSTWLKTVLKFCALFVSSKFSKKMRMVRNIKQLKKLVPMEYIFLPPEVYSIEQMFG